MAHDAETGSAAPARQTNCLLAGLPSDVAERLRPDFTTRPGKVRQVLYRQGDPIEYVYFPNDCVASVTSVLATGAMVETATVGDEGMVGIEAIFAERAVSTGETIVQVPEQRSRDSARPRSEPRLRGMACSSDGWAVTPRYFSRR